MRIAEKRLKKVEIKEHIPEYYNINLVNVQTGEIERSIPTTKTVKLVLGEHEINILLRATAEEVSKTILTTTLCIRADKEIDVLDLAAFFTVYKQQCVVHAHDFDGLKHVELREEAKRRELIRAEVVKQEEKYAKKLVQDEIKRIAKENIDAKRPPITSMLPKTKTKLIE